MPFQATGNRMPISFINNFVPGFSSLSIPGIPMMLINMNTYPIILKERYSRTFVLNKCISVQNMKIDTSLPLFRQKISKPGSRRFQAFIDNQTNSIVGYSIVNTIDIGNFRGLPSGPAAVMLSIMIR